MRIAVNKALDKTPVNFGIRGSYIRYAGIGFAVMFLIAVMVGSMTGFFIGFIVMVAGCAVVYFTISNYQDKVSEKERDRMIASFSLPRRIRVRPVRFHRYIRDGVQSSQKDKRTVTVAIGSKRKR